MEARPYFRCRFNEYSYNDGTRHDEVCGLFQMRIPTVNTSLNGIFGSIIRFQYDSGAESSVMSSQLARDYGLENYEEMSLGQSLIGGYDYSVPPRLAHKLQLWVRFHPHRISAIPMPHIPDGIPSWEFQFQFLVVDDAEMECPLLGVNDMHRFFQLSTRQDYYYFIMRFPTDTDLPRNWDPQATPRRIRPLK